jgi:hypothetical protein
MTLELKFHDPTFEGKRVDDHFDLLLGINATFELCLNDTIVYQEPMFPIAELRAALLAWLSEHAIRHEDFEFESMESEERGLVWIRWADGKGWQVGSVLQRVDCSKLFSDQEIHEAVERFALEVERWVMSELQVDPPNPI